MEETLLTGRKPAEPPERDEELLGTKFSEERREKALTWLNGLIEKHGEKFVMDHKNTILMLGDQGEISSPGLDTKPTTKEGERHGN